MQYNRDTHKHCTKPNLMHGRKIHKIINIQQPNTKNHGTNTMFVLTTNKAREIHNTTPSEMALFLLCGHQIHSLGGSFVILCAQTSRFGRNMQGTLRGTRTKSILLVKLRPNKVYLYPLHCLNKYNQINESLTHCFCIYEGCCIEIKGFSTCCSLKRRIILLNCGITPCITLRKK
jgi:hypothetical protein